MLNPSELVRNWERPLIGPDIIQHAEEQVHIVREYLKASQSRQKSNYDRKHTKMVYQPGEQAYLRVTPMSGIIVSDPSGYMPYTHNLRAG